MSFKKLEGDTAIVVQSGVYKQADLYTLNNGLFASYGNGFVRLKKDGSTSRDKLNLIQLIYDGELHSDQFGRLLVKAITNSKKIAVKANTQFFQTSEVT